MVWLANCCYKHPLRRHHNSYSQLRLVLQSQEIAKLGIRVLETFGVHFVRSYLEDSMRELELRNNYDCLSVCNIFTLGRCLQCKI